jgi:hypothetical protein
MQREVSDYNHSNIRSKFEMETRGTVARSANKPMHRTQDMSQLLRTPVSETPKYAMPLHSDLSAASSAIYNRHPESRPALSDIQDRFKSINSLVYTPKQPVQDRLQPITRSNFKKRRSPYSQWSDAQFNFGVYVNPSINGL